MKAWAIALMVMLVMSVNALNATAQTKDEQDVPEISVAKKVKKKLTLLAIKNNSNTGVFGFEIKVSDGSVRFIKAKGWDREKIDVNTVLIQTNEQPVTKGRNMIVLMVLDNKEAGIEWKAYGERRTIIALGQLVTSKTTDEEQQPNIELEKENIVSKYGDKYTTPISENGDGLFQFGYLWDHDPLTVHIIINNNVQREDKEYDFDKLIREALDEWSYKLRKASGKENSWSFNVKTFYLGKDGPPENKADINIYVGSGNFVDYWANAPCYTSEYLKYVTEEAPFIARYTRPIKYWIDTHTLDEIREIELIIDERYNAQTSKERLAISSMLHDKFQHGNLVYCDIKLELFIAEITSAKYEGYGIISKGKLSPTSYKSIAKAMIGIALGLGRTHTSPNSIQGMDLMTFSNDMFHVGWNPEMNVELFVSQQDIEALLSIYGDDGFGGTNNKHPLNDCILVSLVIECNNIDLSNTYRLDLDIIIDGSVKIGKRTKFDVEVSGNDEKVSKATVNCVIVDPSGVIKSSFAGDITDDNGKATFTLTDRDVMKSGSYIIKCMAMKEPYYDVSVHSKKFYFDGYGSAVFEVITG